MYVLCNGNRHVRESQRRSENKTLKQQHIWKNSAMDCQAGYGKREAILT